LPELARENKKEAGKSLSAQKITFIINQIAAKGFVKFLIFNCRKYDK